MNHKVATKFYPVGNSLMMVQEEISMLVTSDPNQGAINRTADGSAFEVQLETPIEIPRDAMNVKVSCEESTIWWVIPNITTGVNDKFYVTGDDNQVVPVQQNFVITIAQGLYDLTTLNQSLLSGLEAAGARTDPEPIIQLGADSATQKVLLRLNYTNSSVDFTPQDTSRDILGFNSQVVGPNAGAPINILADNVAAFNEINSFLIHSDIVGKGIRFNNTYNQTITQVLIDVAPGSQIVSTPFNPAKSDANELRGAKRTNIRFFLTDDSNRPVDTNTEFWTTRLVISYMIPVIIN